MNDSPILSDDDINLCRNAMFVNVVIPKTLEKIINWGCDKAADETYWDYLLRKNRNPMRWFRAERLRLQETTCQNFDVPLLIMLVPALCECIGSVGINNRFVADYERIESSLTQLKSMRNEICHGPRGAISPNVYMEGEKLCVKLLAICGQLYSIDASEVQREVDEITYLVTQARDVVFEVKESERLRRATFSINCIREMGEQIKNEVMLPVAHIKVELTEVFHPINLLVEDTGYELEVKKDRTLVVKPCSEMFQDFNENVCIEGLPGSGKTTLMKRLQYDFASQDAPEYFTGIRKFDIMLYMNCRDKIRSCSQLLLQNFPRTLRGLDVEQPLNWLKSMDVLTVVDGLDELNETSIHLLNQLIDVFGVHGKATFIFTSRPGSRQILNDILERRGLNFLVASVQPITKEEQVGFLRRYADSIPGFSTDDFDEVFSQIRRYDLTHPMDLLNYFQILISSTGSIRREMDEFDILSEIKRISSGRIKSILEASGSLSNIAESTEDFLEDLGNLTLQLLRHNKLSIDSSTMHQLCNKYFDKASASHGKIISCLFSEDLNQTTFQFTHKTLMEFIAATAITSRLESDPKTSIESIFVAIINESSGAAAANRSGGSETCSSGAAEASNNGAAAAYRSEGSEACSSETTTASSSGAAAVDSSGWFESCSSGSIGTCTEKKKKRDSGGGIYIKKSGSSATSSSGTVAASSNEATADSTSEATATSSSEPTAAGSREAIAASSSEVAAAGSSRVVSWERPYLLKHVIFTQFQNVFVYVIMKLVKESNRETLRRCLDEICGALAEEGVEFSYWYQLALRCPSSEDVAEKAARAAKKVAEEAIYPEGRTWKVNTHEQIDAVTRMLTYHQPPELALQPTPPETWLDSRFSTLLGTVSCCHAGILSLHLQDSFEDFSPADDLLSLLHSASCKLVWFQGSLGGSGTAWKALVQAVQRASSSQLFISLTEPGQHQLGVLRDHVELEVRARIASGYGELPPHPLPYIPNHPPVLTLIGTAETETNGVASLVNFLAPSDQMFHTVAMKIWSDDNSLLKVANDLKDAGVKTRHSALIPRWVEVGCGRDGKCVVCWKLHEVEQRCIRFWI